MGWILGAGLLAYLWYQSQSGTGAASSISTGTPSPATPSTSAAPLLPGDAIYFGPVGSGQTFTFGSQSFAVPGYVYYAPSTGQSYETTTPPTNDQAKRRHFLHLADRSSAVCPFSARNERQRADGKRSL